GRSVSQDSNRTTTLDHDRQASLDLAMHFRQSHVLSDSRTLDLTGLTLAANDSGRFREPIVAIARVSPCYQPDVFPASATCRCESCGYVQAVAAMSDLATLLELTR